MASAVDSTRETLLQVFYEQVTSSETWDAGRLAAHGRLHLERLLRHAHQNVPFYARRLDPVFRRDGSIDWQAFEHLPIVTRADMLAHRPAMQARMIPAGHGPVGLVATSGSSGLPITVTISGIATVAAQALVWRAQRWAGIDWSLTLMSRLGDGDHARRFPEGEQAGRFGPPAGPPDTRGKVHVVSREFDTPAMLDFFRRFEASYLNAGPNMAHINALDAERLGIDIRIERILAQGNMVTAGDRAACRRVFGAEIVEFYSAKEGGQMASTCPAGRLHVNLEACHLEVLHPDGRPCAPGETGRVVVTPYFQSAQPLIRYDQGDWATVGAACPCGRAHPVLERIVGRNIAIFRHPDGRAVANLMPDETRSLLAARYFQLAQVGPNGYELRYVPADAARPADEQAVQTLFNDTYFADATLSFRRMADIPLSSGGKLVEYVNEFERDLR